MKTYIIDWGKSCNGGRFALLQAENASQAFWHADRIGSPFKMAELKIKPDGDGLRYIEIEAPQSRYLGKTIGSSFQFKESFELLLQDLSSRSKT